MDIYRLRKGIKVNYLGHYHISIILGFPQSQGYGYHIEKCWKLRLEFNAQRMIPNQIVDK